MKKDHSCVCKHYSYWWSPHHCISHTGISIYVVSQRNISTVTDGSQLAVSDQAVSCLSTLCLCAVILVMDGEVTCTEAVL